MNKLLITVLILFVSLGFKCGVSKNQPGNSSDGVFRGQLHTDKQLVTPLGAKLFSRTEINPELLPLADAGLNRLNEIASTAPNNYTNLAAPSAYNIYLFPRSPRCENAAFLLDGGGNSQYDNGDFDKDPRKGFVTICAAGMVVGTNDYSMLVVDDVEIMSTIVRYEGEHILTFNVDRERYEATKFHTAENYHPILGDGVQSIAGPRSGAKKPIQTTQAVTVDLKGKQICILLSK